MYLGDPRPCTITVVSGVSQFLSDVDDTTRVHDVVGRVQHPGLGQPVAVGVGRELVVGAATDRSAIELGNALLVQRRAQRTRAEDVARDSMDVIGIDDRRSRPRCDRGGDVGPDIGDREAGPGLGEIRRQSLADLAARH